MSRKLFRWSFALLILFFCGGTVFFLQTRERKASEEAFRSKELAGRQLTITTKEIQILPAHKHDPHEAFDAIPATDEMLRGPIFDSVEVLSDPVIVPEDVWVTGFHVAVNDGPADLLHHEALLRMDRMNPICPEHHDEVFATALPIRESAVLPDPYAEFLPKGTPLVFSATIHNTLPPYGPGGVYEHVSASAMLDTIPAVGVSRTPVEFIRLHLDDDSCKDPFGVGTFTVPARTEHFTKNSADDSAQDSARYVFPHDGRIILLGAHLHGWEGGEEVTFFLNGSVIQNFTPYLNGSDPWSWTLPITYPENLTVRAGDTVAISATYSNPDNLPIFESMGMVGFFWAPSAQK